MCVGNDPLYIHLADIHTCMVALHDVIRMHRHPAQGNVITARYGNHIYALRPPFYLFTASMHRNNLCGTHRGQ